MFVLVLVLVSVIVLVLVRHSTFPIDYYDGGNVHGVLLLIITRGSTPRTRRLVLLTLVLGTHVYKVKVKVKVEVRIKVKGGGVPGGSWCNCWFKSWFWSWSRERAGFNHRIVGPGYAQRLSACRVGVRVGVRT